jgi:hypothetical protein
MNKSFKQRLEALEALESERIAFDQSELTWDDRELLYMAISTYRVTLNASGWLTRAKAADSIDDLDQALARCNAALARLVPRLRTLEEVDAWIRELEDPNTFDEDELLG